MTVVRKKKKRLKATKKNRVLRWLNSIIQTGKFIFHHGGEGVGLLKCYLVTEHKLMTV